MRSWPLVLTSIVAVPAVGFGQDAAALAPHIKNLKHTDDAERIKAMGALADLGAKAKLAAYALCESAAHEIKPELRAEAWSALAKVRPDLAPHVVTLLDGTDPPAVIAAAQAIGKMGPADGVAGSWALRFGRYRCDRGRFADPTPIAAACTAALGDVRPPDKDVTHEVGQSATLNKSSAVRLAAVRTLGQFAFADREQHKAVLTYLQIALRDRDAAVRVAVLQEARSLGPDARPMLKAIQTVAAKDESDEVKRAAAAAAMAIVGK